MKIKFHKYHALGNDYIVINPNETEINLNTEIIKLICHRNFGIGSDGILYGPIIDDDGITLRIFNPDGSEAEKSGNGIRIFSKYLCDSNYVSENRFSLNTLGGRVFVEIIDKNNGLIKVDMGKTTFQSNLIPVNGPVREVINEPVDINGKEYKATCISIGNPHCVIPIKNVSKDLALELGPKVENHLLFPNRINMQLLEVLDEQNIKIEIWERGAGYTLASGSSSCAAASVAYKLGLTKNEIKVHMPGGVINIDIKRDGHVFMTGTVCNVASGELSEQLINKIDCQYIP